MLNAEASGRATEDGDAAIAKVGPRPVRWPRRGQQGPPGAPLGADRRGSAGPPHHRLRETGAITAIRIISNAAAATPLLVRRASTCWSSRAPHLRGARHSDGEPLNLRTSSVPSTCRSLSAAWWTTHGAAPDAHRRGKYRRPGHLRRRRWGSGAHGHRHRRRRSRPPRLPGRDRQPLRHVIADGGIESAAASPRPSPTAQSGRLSQLLADAAEAPAGLALASAAAHQYPRGYVDNRTSTSRRDARRWSSCSSTHRRSLRHPQPGRRHPARHAKCGFTDVSASARGPVHPLGFAAFATAFGAARVSGAALAATPPFRARPHSGAPLESPDQSRRKAVLLVRKRC